MGRGRRTTVDFDSIPFELRKRIVEAHNQYPELPFFEIARMLKCQTYMVKSVICVVDKTASKKVSSSVLDPHINEIRRLWEDCNCTKTKIAEIYGVSVGHMSKYMLEHGISNEKRLEADALWNKSIDDVIGRNFEHEKVRKTDLESLGLRVVVNGNECYDVSSFFGIESPNEVKIPEWKLKLHALGIVNYGKEYGKFGSDAYKRSQFYMQNCSKLKLKGEL